MIVIALLIATAIPILALVGIHSLDFYKTGEFRFVLICSAAGMVAYGAAALINPTPLHLGWISYNQMVRYLAPVVEEILKALILLVLVRRPKFTYFVDGAIYGFATGIGFAICENYEYIFGHVGAAMSMAVSRVISTNLMHAAACATVGIVLGWARFQKPARRTLLNAGGILLAILLHMGYNNLVTRVTSGWLLVYAVLVGGGAAGLIALMIRRGLKDERAWIQEKLGVTDRVERQEVAAVQNIARVEDVLKRLAGTFGPAAATKIEGLLYTQARLGILRKMADKMSDEKMRTGIQSEIEQLHLEMEQARRAIGSYAMVYLRYTHLEEMFSVYDILGTRIQEQMAQGRAPGMGVFDRLKQHVVTSPQNPDESEE
jgi:RsiW-degrading membrane proteinase PrsW (M82 family)